MEKCSCTRREFLVAGAKVTAALGVATFFISSNKLWAEGESEEPNFMRVDLLLKENEALRTKGGILFIKNPSKKREKIILIREDDKVVKALKNYCPHKGGPLKKSRKDGLLVCGWHKARFNLSGKVKKGPAEEDLKSFEAKLEGEIITITL